MSHSLAGNGIIIKTYSNTILKKDLDLAKKRKKELS